MKRLVILSALLLGACGGRAHVVAPSEVSRPTELIETDKLVPVLCDERVELDPVDSDKLTKGMPLEDKAYILLRSDGQHRKNTATLSAAALKCGVRISTKK